MKEAIRNQYAKKGVTAYYQEEGAHYQNPHFTQIRTLLLKNQHRIDYTRVLDFCCGSGEVSQVLAELGFNNTQASDPFTLAAYQQHFAKECWPHSFNDVIRGKMIGHRFSSIICSFAMHLCPKKQLYPLVFKLFQCTSQIVIITPHKRPVLENLAGVQLAFEDISLTKKGKKVKLKAYHFSIG